MWGLRSWAGGAAVEAFPLPFVTRVIVDFARIQMMLSEIEPSLDMFPDLHINRKLRFSTAPLLFTPSRS